MFILIVGCGRTGSRLGRYLIDQEGNTVSVMDRDPEAHARLEVGLDQPWEELGGRFTVGAALETDALELAGIEEADAFVAATNGDNTNIVISQIAKEQYGVDKVVARIMDPARAKWYRNRGLEIVCPTSISAGLLGEALGYPDALGEA
ncbi:MAG: potassium channel family protein [Solirubrobacterales bacterium]